MASTGSGIKFYGPHPNSHPSFTGGTTLSGKMSEYQVENYNNTHLRSIEWKDPFEGPLDMTV